MAKRASQRGQSATSDRVHRRLERLRGEMVEVAARFCSIATVNPPGSHYEECVEFLADKLRGLGLATRAVRVPKAVQEEVLPGSADYPRLSVVARWDAGAKRTLHFTGHYDVVPATSGWKTDPFTPVVTRGRLVARGADDMKCSITAAIFAVQAMMDAGVRPAWNVELSCTPDEETGGELGLGYLVKTRQIRPDAAVLCEGGCGDHIGYAHKGVLWLEVTVLGKASHACVPHEGINALEKACGLIEQLKTLDTVYARRKTAFRTEKAIHKRPTLMIGGISGGGGKVNTVPDRFTFTIDRRLSPAEGLRDARAEITAVIKGAMRRDRKLKVRVKTLLHVPPGWTDLGCELAKVAAAAFRAVRGKRPTFRMTPGFTDMHWLTQDAGVPTVMYGTTGEGAHGDGEYTRIASMIDAARIYAEIATRLPPEATSGTKGKR